jgi:hypothetical protein
MAALAAVVAGTTRFASTAITDPAGRLTQRRLGVLAAGEGRTPGKVVVSVN